MDGSVLSNKRTVVVIAANVAPAPLNTEPMPPVAAAPAIVAAVAMKPRRVQPSVCSLVITIPQFWPSC